MSANLKPCPACGTAAEIIDLAARCGRRVSCGVRGPNLDPDGAKWNALPRRGDAVGMSDGELVARAIRENTKQAHQTMCDVIVNPGSPRLLEDGALHAELDRRAEARSRP